MIDLATVTPSTKQNELLYQSYISPEGKDGDQMGKRKCISASKENKGIDEAKRTEDNRKTEEKGERGKSLTFGDFGTTERLFDNNVTT